MGVQLYDYQLDAIKRMKTGCVLCGDVGSGKSLTSIGYYYIQNGGEYMFLDGGEYIPMGDPPKDLYIITTAKKRDNYEWSTELSHFLLSIDENINLYQNKVIVDSWNNVKKYKDVRDAFFIFDEQRVVGTGVWVKSFLKIARNNDWILLSATPGDTWSDYLPLFMANGFFKTKTDFTNNHVIYDRFSKFPKIKSYYNTGKLLRFRNDILIDMDFKRETKSTHNDIYVNYDALKYKEIGKKRWNPYTNEPIKNASELCYVWRRVVNEDISRQIALLEIFENHPKMIIFYNFDYELEILRNLGFGKYVTIAEWNGHKHEKVPDTPSWVYLVQYTSGCEGWNCITTDTIVFFSQNYSYKVMKQAAGRIDRVNTPYSQLYYYHLKTRSKIDLAISAALKHKRKFNESRFISRS